MISTIKIQMTQSEKENMRFRDAYYECIKETILSVNNKVATHVESILQKYIDEYYNGELSSAIVYIERKVNHSYMEFPSYVFIDNQTGIRIVYVSEPNITEKTSDIIYNTIEVSIKVEDYI